jgi:hypothetical protein
MGTLGKGGAVKTSYLTLLSRLFHWKREAVVEPSRLSAIVFTDARSPEQREFDEALAQWREAEEAFNVAKEQLRRFLGGHDAMPANLGAITARRNEALARHAQAKMVLQGGVTQ